MAGKLKVGSVITVPATGKTPHRCVIVGDDESNGDWLVIPICSHHIRADSTVVIETSFFAGLVDHKSYIAYYMAKKISKGNTWEHRCDLPADKLELIKAGIGTSKETEPWFKDDYAKLTAPVKKGRVLRREED